MGSVCAMLLCEKGFAVRMWGYDAEQLAQIEKKRENFKFLPGYKLPDTLIFEPKDSEILKNADLIISAVPCQYMRQVWERLAGFANLKTPIVSTTKGIENDTLLRPSQVLSDVLGDDIKVIVLSGPTIADEIVRKLPATATAASASDPATTAMSHTIHLSRCRLRLR